VHHHHHHHLSDVRNGYNKMLHNICTEYKQHKNTRFKKISKTKKEEATDTWMWHKILQKIFFQNKSRPEVQIQRANKA